MTRIEAIRKRTSDHPVRPGSSSRRAFLVLTSIRSRRKFLTEMGALGAGVGLLGLSTRAASAQNPDPHADQAYTIHQEIDLKASRHQVYQALSDENQFDAITRLSDGARLLARPNAQKTQLTAVAGSAFVLFGGVILGRQIELIEDERIVQAWRVAHWPDGQYSIARFCLAGLGGGTRLVFDHQGFPEGEARDLAQGWQDHYWVPLAKYLAGQ